MDEIQKSLLEKIADIHEVPEGAYNIRSNGQLEGRNTTANIDIVTKRTNRALILLSNRVQKMKVCIFPVILSESGLKDMVYNDFYIGEGADVTIVAGCGIHNCGVDTSEHDGIHTFYIGKNAKVKYIEKHYGEGDGAGERILNPTTIVHIEDGGYMEMETTRLRVWFHGARYKGRPGRRCNACYQGKDYDTRTPDGRNEFYGRVKRCRLQCQCDFTFCCQG